jgi:poly(3-hydroxybutyrate) depolymerase
MHKKATLLRPLPTAAVVVLALALGPRAASAQAPTDPYLGMEGHILDAGNIQLPYRLARPAGYDANKKYPLVVFLHGSGESGTDNKLQIQKNIGVPTGGSVFTLPATQAKYPNFFVAPQAPTPGAGGWGDIRGQAVLKLIADLEQQFSSIDTRRIYITGLSMGGFGTWSLIEDNPSLFACAVPMSAGGDTAKAVKIAALPIWDFHGTLDASVPVQQSRDMIAALQAAGGHPKYTEYPNGGHAIWDQAYTEPELLPWMFGTQAATIDTDGGLLDGAGVLDTGVGAMASDSSAGGALDGAAAMEAASVVGSGGGSGQDSGSMAEQPSGDQSSGCSCRMAEARSIRLSGYACLFALGISMLRRRRTGFSSATSR